MNAPLTETPYFRCKWYKNGNLHIEFRSPDLLRRLNQFGGDHEQVPGLEKRRRKTFIIALVAVVH
jgi:hypothetical protein